MISYLITRKGGKTIKNFKYKCEQNDVVVNVEFENGKLDELQVGTVLENEWAVLGFEDLEKLMLKSGYKIVKS